MKKLITVLTLALLGSVMAFAGTAAAHHPLISAEIVCDDPSGELVINYVSTAWAGDGTDASRSNAQIDIYVDYVLADSGSYTAPDFSFSGTLPIPAGKTTGDTVTVTTLAVADWGNGYPGGSGEGVWLEIPDLNCDGDLSNGRFTGGGHQISRGVKITRGLTIHCDRLLSNNLEINWQGNQFHLNEHLTTVECSDDPDIGQAPPPAPLDTLIATGTGRYNNADGYSISFTLVDGGEPGGDDMAAIHITEDATGAVILDVPLQVMTGGNLQAHYDQPHR